MNEQESPSSPIGTKEDVWIEANAVILKRVSIGSGAIIAEGTVLRTPVNTLEIWGGVPAKEIVQRNSE